MTLIPNATHYDFSFQVDVSQIFPPSDDGGLPDPKRLQLISTLCPIQSPLCAY